MTSADDDVAVAETAVETIEPPTLSDENAELLARLTAVLGADALVESGEAIGDLVVETLDRWGHLVGDRSRDHDEVGLTRACRERDDTEPHDVVAGAGKRRAHFDRTACKAPLEHPERVFAAVIQQFTDWLEWTFAQCPVRD